jgi:DNA-binding LacI/PurR family transcriptional regulator
MRRTIRDVSDRARVSIGTVSNVLNAPHLVAEETRRRVLEAVEELDYRPSRAARSLAGRRTHLVAYHLPEPLDGGSPTLDAFLHRLVTTAAVYGLEVVIFAPRPGQSEVSALREVIARKGVDGFILSNTNYDDPRIDELLSRGFPFVTFGRSDRADEFAWVDVDGAAGTAAMVAHLVGMGHRRIAMVAWPPGSESGDGRAEGFFTGCAAAGIEPGPFIRAENTLNEGRRAFRQVMNAAEPPTAIVAVQDTLAFGLMSEAIREGMVVGRDLAVTGFDDIPAAALTTPPLTSVRQPIAEVGQVLVDLLVGQIEGGIEPGHRLLAPELVIRQSCGGGA